MLSDRASFTEAPFYDNAANCTYLWIHGSEWNYDVHASLCNKSSETICSNYSWSFHTWCDGPMEAESITVTIAFCIIMTAILVSMLQSESPTFVHTIPCISQTKMITETSPHHAVSISHLYRIQCLLLCLSESPRCVHDISDILKTKITTAVSQLQALLTKYAKSISMRTHGCTIRLFLLSLSMMDVNGSCQSIYGGNWGIGETCIQSISSGY